MEIQEMNELTEQGEILSDNELASIKRMLGKTYQNKEILEQIEGMLKDKQLFTIIPTDEDRSGGSCFEGILQDRGVLLVFTNLEECEEYGKRHAAVRMGSNYRISMISSERVLEVAAAYGKEVYIDIRQRTDDRFLVYDGKAGTLHLCIVQKM